MPTWKGPGQPLEFTPDEISEMSNSALSAFGWKLYHKYNIGSTRMPSGMWYSGAVGDELDAALIEREKARQRMAAQAAELDRQKITGRWCNILAQMLAGVTERSRATGVPHYVNSRGETVDQLGRPLENKNPFTA
jgi:hypothetical protein